MKTHVQLYTEESLNSQGQTISFFFGRWDLHTVSPANSTRHRMRGKCIGMLSYNLKIKKKKPEIQIQCGWVFFKAFYSVRLFFGARFPVT